jgi:hypothetical protein
MAEQRRGMLIAITMMTTTEHDRGMLIAITMMTNNRARSRMLRSKQTGDDVL